MPSSLAHALPIDLMTTLHRVDETNHTVTLLDLAIPKHQPFHYRAGQYIKTPWPDGRLRSFSIAGPPIELARTGLLRFHIRTPSVNTGTNGRGGTGGTGGTFVQHLRQLKKGDRLPIQGPFGSFGTSEQEGHIPHLSNGVGRQSPLILLAGGTGIAPIHAMLWEWALTHHDPIRNRPLYLYWGLQSPVEHYLPEALSAWLAHFKNLRVVIAYSGTMPHEIKTPAVHLPIHHRGGLIHKAVLEDFPTLDDPQLKVLASGSPAMLKAAYDDFIAAQLSPTCFFADGY